MSHFAKLDANNIVVFVTAGRQEDDGNEAELCARTGDCYVQTSYNTRAGVHVLGGTPLRYNFAAVGDFYDSGWDAFVPPRPFPSWTLSTDTFQWSPPTPYPTDGVRYEWDEATQTWEPVDA